MKKYLFLIKAAIFSIIIITIFWMQPIGSMIYLDDVNINELTQLRINTKDDLTKFGELASKLPGNLSRSGEGIVWGPEASIQVNYNNHGSDIFQLKRMERFWRKNKEKIILFNSTAYLILMPAAQRITVELDVQYKQKFEVTRKDLENFYRRDLNEYYTNPSLWEKEVIKETINSRKKLKAFFEAYKIMQL